jgi:phospholipase/lecithinase/hemolysin
VRQPTSHLHSRPSLTPLLLLLLVLSANLAHAQTYNSIVVFGDSLSDTGNVAHLTASEFGVRYPSRNVSLGFNFTDGRFTDGVDTAPAASAYLGVWVEQLAAFLPLKPLIKNSLDGGTNYAYGDATTNDGTRTVTESGVSLTLNNMGQQVTDYLATRPTPTAQTLYVLWGGSNDVYADSSAPGVAVAVAREAALIQRLIAVGATNFLVPNLPPLGGVPDHASDPTSAATLNAAALSFDIQLAATLNGIVTSSQAQGKPVTILQPDIFTRFSSAANNPSAIGLANVSSAAQGVSGNSDTYLIWDGLHPTTTGHHFAAATAAALITPLSASISTLSLVPAAIPTGGIVTLKATVQSATATPAAPGLPATGLVTFFSNGTTPIGSATLATVAGIATATTSFTGTAFASSPYSITAVYVGDTVYNTSISAAQTLNVTALIPTTSALSSSAPSSNLGASITFTAKIIPGAGAGAGTPTGSVTFLDGQNTRSTASLDASGTATYTTSTLEAGNHTITAQYSGDPTYSFQALVSSVLPLSAVVVEAAADSASDFCSF